MASIKVDSTAMRDKATTFTNVATTIQGLTNDMNNTINGTEAYWKGQAADALRENFRKLEATFQEKYDSINNYASFLNQAADAYDSVESKNTTS